jgi:hypothetical protein
VLAAILVGQRSVYEVRVSYPNRNKSDPVAVPAELAGRLTGLACAMLIALFVSALFLCAVFLSGCKERSTSVGTVKDNTLKGFVGGDSMAPHLLDAHLTVDCSDCGITYAFGTSMVPPDNIVVCPNCGSNTSTDNAAIRSSDQVTIRRGNDAFDRWDIVAIKDQSKTSALVKRIVGLPGEQITLKEGDIWINGERINRPLATVKSMGVSIFDAQYQSRNHPRLVSVDPNGWRQTEKKWRLPKQIAASANTFALKYVHRQNYRTKAMQIDVSPVKDNYPYNQYITRDLNNVTDLVVQCEQIIGQSLENWQLKIHDGIHFAIVKWDPKQDSLLLGYGDKTLANVNGVDLSGRHCVTFSLIDGYARFALDEKTLISCQIPAPGTPKNAVAPCVGIEADRDIELTGLKIYRDLFYFPDPSSGRQQWTLGPDQFFVIGDNVPLSKDSRSQSVGPINRSQLVGKIIESYNESESLSQ